MYLRLCSDTIAISHLIYSCIFGKHNEENIVPLTFRAKMLGLWDMGKTVDKIHRKTDLKMFFNQPLSSSTGSASSERAVLSCHCLLLRQGLQEIPLGQKFSDSIKYCTRISQSYVDFSVPLCPFALRFKKKHTRKRIFLYS